MNRIKFALLIAIAPLFFLNASAESRQLFNGKDLAGWTHVGFGEFSIENAASGSLYLSLITARAMTT